MSNRLVTIIGPTAVGKTKVAIEIAQKISGEIISADSRQIYKYLTIGTAKPSHRERREVTFHLIDFVEIDEHYSCGQFARDAGRIIEEIRKRKKIPLICGGTGLYIRALFKPLHGLPQSTRTSKEKLILLQRKHGIAYLYKKLQTVDPDWAKKIGPNDKQRILRGLEIYEMTGIPLSRLIKKRRKISKYYPYYIGLKISREQLYKRINHRFDAMIRHGLIDEVTSLLDRGFDPTSNALRTIGYKEIIEYIQGKLSLDQAIGRTKQRTRNYAKRQITWFNKMPGVHWFNPDNPGTINAIIRTVNKVCIK